MKSISQEWVRNPKKPSNKLILSLLRPNWPDCRIVIRKDKMTIRDSARGVTSVIPRVHSDYVRYVRGGAYSMVKDAYYALENASVEYIDVIGGRIYRITDASNNYNEYIFMGPDRMVRRCIPIKTNTVAKIIKDL